MSDDRKLVYAFVSLNYLIARDLALRFITLTAEELALNTPANRSKLHLLILTRVRDEGKLEAFRTAVFEQKAKDDAE